MLAALERMQGNSLDIPESFMPSIDRAVQVFLCFVAIAAGAPARLAAQGPAGRVTLSVTVPAHATVEHHAVARLHGHVGDTATFTATVVIRANAPYRIVARGDAGLTTFELTYRALTDDDTPSAPPVVFEAMPDVLRPSSR